MRRIVRAAYLGDKLGDTSALGNPASLAENNARGPSARRTEQAADWLGLRGFVIKRHGMLWQQDVHGDLPFFLNERLRPPRFAQRSGYRFV